MLWYDGRLNDCNDGFVCLPDKIDQEVENWKKAVEWQEEEEDEDEDEDEEN